MCVPGFTAEVNKQADELIYSVFTFPDIKKQWKEKKSVPVIADVST